ncbi:MAG: threonine--tRNA ligase [Robiginitomaculum sp.]|nr:threonine--tRNA ligase [Robiginitomaculum sp.]MDQ7076650.1 threonine--tRNA ligase [Robiginitomaculum sp.]
MTKQAMKSIKSMIDLEFPDGSHRQFEDGATGLDVAMDISPGLAKQAFAITLNGELRDLNREIEKNGTVRIITARDPEGLELIRHDAAHVLAEAVQELFPGTQVTIGPIIEDGFYYDFAREEPFSTEDFEKIEAKMAEIIARNEPITREVWDRNEAIALFEKMGEKFKAELISDLPEDETITLYRQGNWVDLCKGPHLPSTGKIPKAYKLMKLAGAYWRGDSSREQLQRIYGTAWTNPKELRAYLTRLEEAEKRDHRRLGNALNLFHFQEEAQGQVFWHPNGWTLYRAVQDYMRRRQIGAGYEEIHTPQLMDRKFWEQSGHWEKYREHMFISSIDQEDKVLAVKPMNCPCHVQVFNHGQKSYRDLPLRLAEFGSCHRYEPSGALHGLMRVRAFTQDDAHIFCREDQITDEVKAFCTLLQSVYADFGFTDVQVRFADRPDKRVGSDEVWDKAEAALKTAADATGLEVVHNPGDGAFYGPKLDFVLRDAIGREWQTGTIQADFTLPERLDASYVGQDGEKHRPIMLHRAILGSFERFLGILLEHHAGNLPLWLAPVQVVVTTITTDTNAYAQEAADILSAAGLRVKTDLRNEKINYKVREHSHAKVPVIAVAGHREADERTLALRFLGEGGKHQQVMSLDEVIADLSVRAAPPDLKPH